MVSSDGFHSGSTVAQYGSMKGQWNGLPDGATLLESRPHIRILSSAFCIAVVATLIHVYTTVCRSQVGTYCSVFIDPHWLHRARPAGGGWLTFTLGTVWALALGTVVCGAVWALALGTLCDALGTCTGHCVLCVVVCAHTQI